MESYRSLWMQLPKAEYHLHLEGSAPWDLVRFFMPDAVANPREHHPDFRFDDFAHFERFLFAHAEPFILSAERMHALAKGVFKEAQRQGIVYLETSFHVAVSSISGIPVKELVDAIVSACPYGLELRLIAGLLRNAPELPGMDAILSELPGLPGVAGIDFHGDERALLEEWAVQIARDFEARGKLVKCHGGEFSGPENVKDILEKLPVRRIEHGLGILHDEGLCREARQRGIIFDLCPVSNFKLRAVDRFAEHPLRAIQRHGLAWTLSRDDPMVFGNDLWHDYQMASVVLDKGIREMAAQCWDAADVPESQKRSYQETCLDAGESLSG